MVTDEERKVFGFLGKIPEEILGASVRIVVAYKNLAEEAASVARMRNSPHKEMLAKQIEGRYRGLIEEAVQEKERASNGQR
jgi:hypothetical protein